MPGGSKKPTGAFIHALAGILRGQVGTLQLKQEEIAQAIGISRGQMSKILRGEKQIDLEQLDELCWVIGLSFRDTVVAADERSRLRHGGPEWTVPTLVHH